MVRSNLHFVTPSRLDARNARRAGEAIGKFGGKIRLRGVGTRQRDIELPPPAAELLAQLLKELSEGNGVTVIPQSTQLTTQQSARLLGVSRPHLIKLIDSGAVRATTVGTHRRVSVEELVRYLKRSYTSRSAKLDRLSAEAQRLGMGY